MYETVVNKITIKKVSQERSFLAMNITGSKISKLNVPPEVSVTVESDNWPLEMFDACTMGEQLPPRSKSNPGTRKLWICLQSISIFIALWSIHIHIKVIYSLGMCNITLKN